MSPFRKISRTLTAIIIAPVYWFEKKEREKELEERLRRLKRKRLK